MPDMKFHFGDVKIEVDPEINYVAPTNAGEAYDVLLFSQGDYFSGNFIQES